MKDYIYQSSAATNAMGINMRRYHQDAGARNRTDAAHTKVQQIHTPLVQLTPPTSGQVLHDLVLDATKECSAAMDFYRGAFAATNANVDVHTGYALLQRCRARLARLLAWFATVTGLASAVASTTAIARRSRETVVLVCLNQV